MFMYVFIDTYTYIFFPGGSDGKASALQGGRPRFDPWVGKILWRRKWQATPVLLPEKSHGRRSRVGYSPWGYKELDTPEQLHFHYTYIPVCITESLRCTPKTNKILQMNYTLILKDRIVFKKYTK